MSYTLKYTGAEIDDILDRAAPGGTLDDDIAAKQDALTFDAVPTEGSTNPAESGGIYDAIQAGGATALAAYVTDTAEGSIASFSDGADNIPVKDLTAQITPKQDLHGYEYPWPSGSGKNLIPYPYFTSDGTIASVPFTTESDGRIKATGTTNTSMYFYLSKSISLAAGTYTLSVKGNHTGVNIRARDLDSSTTLKVINGSTSDASDTFTVDSAVNNLQVDVFQSTSGTSISLDCTIQLEKGGSATSYAPYSNICPISGWTGANITRAGANLWGETWELGAYDTTTGAPYTSNNQIRVKNAEPITVPPSTEINFSMTGTAGRISNIFWYDADDNFISYYANASAATFQQTSPANAHYLRFQCSVAYGATYKNDITVNVSNASINGNYYPYQGSTILLDFGQTVYAGTLTYIGNGQYKIQPTYEMILLGNLTSISKTADGIFASALQGRAKGQGVYPFVCDTYKQYTGGHSSSSNIASLVAANGDGIYVNAGSGSFYIADHRYTDANTFKQDMGNVVIVYELATYPDPIIVSGSEVRSLLGANNIWADTGEVEVEYRADTKLYIAKVIGGGNMALSMAAPQTLSQSRVDILRDPEAEPDTIEEAEPEGEEPEEE